jgi:hypothetical protein
MKDTLKFLSIPFLLFCLSLMFCWWAWKDVPAQVGELVRLQVQLEVLKKLNEKL